ncbi:uncharacterized protein LOC735156 isoform X10 [Xenopus laevis]|uniref:Uncharacterized protein LOC735156 isoform X10 n=1 Tax=Xenopus laevis TaxID=8355 RepID=A0A8J1LFD9_XENLA|nr:uncharacterized protein LOC735156 isoform X10 [Xenopus laevis]
MEPRTQFTGRYKKDLSTENLRTKVAHRKSVMQKENRHNEFKKCRGLSLTDANISALKECELPPLEETNESSILKAEETTDVGKSKEYLKQRRDLLQRFKEEKELRKLKEQREKAAKCVFKCGIYKPDVTFPPVWSSQHTSKIKPKEKQAPPGVPRVTRSISKAEPAGNKANRTQHVKTGVLNTSKISAERGITKVCGQNSALKKPETKVAPSQRGVRTAVTTTTTATTKPALRNNVVTKSQNKTTKETKTIENSKKSLVCEQPRLKEAKRLPKEKTVEVTSSKESREAPHEKKPSFAPQNFMFQVMDGLSPYKFKPMTPRRANAFLSPCFVRSPMKGERNHLPAPPKCNKTQTAGEQVLPVEQVPEPERSELGMDDNPVAQQKVEQVQVPEPESSELEMDNRLVAQQKVEQVLPVEQVPEPESSELEMDDQPVAQQKVAHVLPVEQVQVPEPESSELEMDDQPDAQQKVEQVLPVEQVQVPEPESSELEMDDQPVAQQKVEQVLPVEQVQVPEPESSELEMDDQPDAQQKVEQVLPVEQVQVPEPESSELEMDDQPVAQQKVAHVLPVEQVQVPEPESSELEMDDQPVAQQKVAHVLPVEQVQVPEPESSELEMDDQPVAQQKVEQVLPVEQVQVPEPESSELEMDDQPDAQQKVEQVLPVEQVQVPEPEISELEMDDHPVAQQKVEQVLPVEQVQVPEPESSEMEDHPVAQQKVAHVLPVEQVQVPEPESSELEMDDQPVAQQKVEQVLPVEQVQVPEPESSELEMEDHPVAQQKVEQVLPVEQVQVPEPERFELEMDDQPVAQQKVEQVLPVEQVQVPEPESSELEMEDHPVAQQKVEQVLPVEQVQVPEPERFELEMDDHPVAQQKVEQVQAPEPESSEQEMEDHPVAQQKMEQVQVPEPEISELEIDDHPVAQQKVPADAPIPPSSPAPNTQKETEQEALKEPEHDVPYFRDILKSESEKLRCLCCEWDKRIELDIPEDAKDVIRTTVGQTRLLMTERFKQFEGLVDNCEFKRGEKETTLTDLEGFWDMIYYQIEDVNKKFFNLGKLEENSWQQGTAPTRKIIKKKIVPAAASKSSQGDNGRAAARSRLAAIKAALKNKGKQEEPTVEAPARPTRVDEVVFDAGFFRVASPAKVANRARCSSSWLSPTPQPITSRIQQSDNPTGEQITEVPNSPATVKSLISKSLFENTEGSVQSDEQHPLPSVVETDEAACVFPVADLAKYLVPMENSGFQLCDSPAPEEVGTVPSRALFLEEIAGISGSFVNDVFMCSPQTNSPPAQPMSPTKESDGVCGTQDLNVQNDQLDFLGSCPPINMINRASFKCGAVAMADNSIVFSPIKKQKNLQRILKHNPELLDS